VELTPGAEALLRGGALAVLPTDTVYGICCAAPDAAACARVYALKERPAEQPTAIVAGSVEALDAILPELPETARERCRRVLPGPVTLIVPNPGRRLLHLCGSSPERIGVRVPALDPALAALADAVGGLLATSANLRGDPAPATLAEVAGELVAASALVVDGGPLPGTPSGVVDVCGTEPAVLRDGSGMAAVVELLR